MVKRNLTSEKLLSSTRVQQKPKVKFNLNIISLILFTFLKYFFDT